jgi:hypothetical protein
MNKKNYSEMLRALTKEFYHSHISFEEYRERRKGILDAIDFEYNGAQESSRSSSGDEQHISSHDAETSVFSTTLNLFRRDGESE